MSITAIAGAVTGITSLASEYIEDKDKRLEFETRKQELQQELMLELLRQETNPWVDGAVKLLTACVALARPLASIGVFVYSAIDPSYLAALKQIDPTLALGAGAAAFGAAPLWGYSRHREKIEQAKGWQH